MRAAGRRAIGPGSSWGRAYGRRSRSARATTALLVLSLASCRAGSARPSAPAESAFSTAGEEIRVCGRRFYVGTPVVLWTEEPGYDAASEHARFGADRTGPGAPAGRRYQPGRKLSGTDGRTLVEPGSDDLESVRDAVDQLVLHYDAAGSSRRCFEILQDERGLSVHFLLDVDGTIYQTLDLRDQAWHATKANPRSIGVEIANLGAFPPVEGAGPRPERIRGVVQGVELEQVDFTPQQYESLAKLAAALCTVFPKIAPDAPRDERGVVRSAALGDAEFESFHGILGHLHVQTNKQDPGPAFDWERFLAAVRRRLAGPEPAP